MLFQISPKCYAKLIGHSAKYPHSTVNGVLIGTISKKDHCVHIQDAIPLFHMDHALSPLLEVALSQVEHYAGHKGLSIVGYYHANELLDDTDINDTASCIGRKIVSNVDVACLIMICNDTVMNCEDQSLSLKLHTYNDSTGNWKEQKDVSLVNGSVQSIKRLILEEEIYKKLVDFDCHLNSVNCDWTNPDINRALETL